ncbi:MAG: adenylate cyclase [Leptospiraceae bacterium]|nr:MAG: adenylate cyclase [Leptospiraceae bacterium]
MKIYKHFVLIFVFLYNAFLYSETYIDLTQHEFYVNNNFSKDYIIEPELLLSDKKTKKVQIPIILDELYPKKKLGKNYNKVEHFTAMTSFYLSKNNLNDSLVLQLAWIGENWEIYLNGNLLKKEIYLNESQQIDIYRTIRGIIIPINNLFLKEGKNILIIHFIGHRSPLQNFVYDNVGFLLKRPYLITISELIENYLIEQIIFGINIVYIFFGIYHFFIFFRRRKEIYNLYFGLFTVLLGIYGITVSMFIHEIIFNSLYVTKIKYATQPLIIPFFLMFFYKYAFPSKKISFILAFFFWVELIFVLFFIIMPIYWLEIGLRLFYASLLFILIYSLYFLYALFKIKNYNLILMIYFAFILFLGVIFEIIDSIYWNFDLRIIEFSFFVFITSIIIIIAYENSNQYKKLKNYINQLNIQRKHILKFVPEQILKYLKKKEIEEIYYGDYKKIFSSVVLFDLEKISKNYHGLDTDLLIFLNDYFAMIEPIVKEENGYIDKFMGNYILATFPESSKTGSSIINAIQCTVKIQQELTNINYFRELQGLFRIDIYSVIHYGEVALGTIGSQNRIDTTIIGDTVNVTSRLEGVAKLYNTKILITEDAINYLLKTPFVDFIDKEMNYYKKIGINNKEYLLRYVDNLGLKGKKLPVKVYEIYNYKSNYSDYENCIRLFYEGLHYFYNKDFKKSEIMLMKCLKKIPEDRIFKIYLLRSMVFQFYPPEKDWEGIYYLKTKGFL